MKISDALRQLVEQVSEDEFMLLPERHRFVTSRRLMDRIRHESVSPYLQPTEMDSVLGFKIVENRHIPENMIAFVNEEGRVLKALTLEDTMPTLPPIVNYPARGMFIRHDESEGEGLLIVKVCVTEPHYIQVHHLDGNRIFTWTNTSNQQIKAYGSDWTYMYAQPDTVGELPDALQQKAEAWRMVAEKLTELEPGWSARHKIGAHAARAMIEAVYAERDHLQKFKRFVHETLDKMDVPKNPPGPHRDAGCRIGQRLEWMREAILHTETEWKKALHTRHEQLDKLVALRKSADELARGIIKAVNASV